MNTIDSSVETLPHVPEAVIIDGRQISISQWANVLIPQVAAAFGPIVIESIAPSLYEQGTTDMLVFPSGVTFTSQTDTFIFPNLDPDSYFQLVRGDINPVALIRLTKDDESLEGLREIMEPGISSQSALNHKAPKGYEEVFDTPEGDEHIPEEFKVSPIRIEPVPVGNQGSTMSKKDKRIFNFVIGNKNRLQGIQPDNNTNGQSAGKVGGRITEDDDEAYAFFSAGTMVGLNILRQRSLPEITDRVVPPFHVDFLTPEQRDRQFFEYKELASNIPHKLTQVAPVIINLLNDEPLTKGAKPIIFYDHNNQRIYIEQFFKKFQLILWSPNLVILQDKKYTGTDSTMDNSVLVLYRGIKVGRNEQIPWWYIERFSVTRGGLDNRVNAWLAQREEADNLGTDVVFVGRSDKRNH